MNRNRALNAIFIAAGLIGTTIFASVLIALFNTGQTEVADSAQATVTTDEHRAIGRRAVEPSQSGTIDTLNVPGPQQPSSANEGSLTINTSGGVASLAVSPDGNVLAGSLLGKPASIQFWNARTGAPIQRFVPDAEKDSTPAQLSYSPQGEFLIYSAGTGVFLLDLDKLQTRKLQQFPTSPRIAVFPTSQLALALFHEQEAHRTELGKIPQRLRVWNWRTNEVLYDEQMAVQQQVPLAHPSVSPDERYLTFAWGHYYVRHDIQLSHDRFGLGSRVTFEKLVRIRGPLVFSPDSKLAAASTKSREYMGAFFEVESGKILHLLDPESAQATNRGHEFGCNFAFTGDGRRIVATDHNGRVAVWEFPAGELVRELEEFHVEANHDPPELAVTKDNRVIVAGDYADSRVRILSLDPSERVTSQDQD